MTDESEQGLREIQRHLDELPRMIEAGIASIPPRWRRWLAMYYPDASVRRTCWKHSGVVMGTGSYANYGMKVVSDPTKEEVVVRIGDRVSIAPGVVFVVDSAPNNSPMMQGHPYIRERLIASGPISVGNDVWIGTNAVIFPGVTVGESAIIGAGSIVREDVEPWTIVAGAPARRIRTLRDPSRGEA